MGYLQFTRIPDSDQYTSLDRLRRTERALSAIIVKLGYRENGTELCLATLIATCIAYHDDCTALNEPTRNQFMRSVILPRASRARGPSSTNGAQTPRSPSTSLRPTRSRSSVSSVPDATARSCRTSPSRVAQPRCLRHTPGVKSWWRLRSGAESKQQAEFRTCYFPLDDLNSFFSRVLEKCP
jgi:hypothetical protein